MRVHEAQPEPLTDLPAQVGDLARGAKSRRIKRVLVQEVSANVPVEFRHKLTRKQRARHLRIGVVDRESSGRQPIAAQIAGAEGVIVADIAQGDIEGGSRLLHAPVRPVTAHDERIAGGEYRRYHCRNRRIEALLEVSGGVDKLLRGRERDALVGVDEPRQIERPYAFADSLRLAALQDTDDALLEDEDVIGAQLGVAAGDVEDGPAVLQVIAGSSLPQREFVVDRRVAELHFLPRSLEIQARAAAESALDLQIGAIAVAVEVDVLS